jgi:ketosteroid isomerase-like protein
LSDTERNRALVRRFSKAVDERDYEALDALLSPDFVRHCPSNSAACSASRATGSRRCA